MRSNLRRFFFPGFSLHMLFPDIHSFAEIIEKCRWLSKQTKKTNCCNTYTACMTDSKHVRTVMALQEGRKVKYSGYIYKIIQEGRKVKYSDGFTRREKRDPVREK